MADEDDFRRFAETRQRPLLRSAYLLCGDWHTAEDLVQTAFGRLFRHWRRVRGTEYPDAYARQVLYRCFLTQRRLKEVATVPIDAAPEPSVASHEEEHDRRAALLAALELLPPRCRAVVVLRFWEDYSVEQTAHALGVSTGTVKSQTSRALGLLRGHLEAGLDEYS